MRFVFLLILFSCLIINIAFADDVSELKEQIKALTQTVQDLKNTVQTQQKEINILKETQTVKSEAAAIQPSVDENKPAKIAQAPQATGLARYFQNFNPEISVIGDVVYHGTSKQGEDYRNQFKFRQAELDFSAALDPYARGDFFFHVEPHSDEWNIGLCEGYLTLLELPIKNLQAKVGKFKANFGKVNRLHLHALPWVDYPNMITNYFGEEGMSQPGVSASYLIPNPWDKYIELTAEIMNNRNGVSFAGSEGRDLLYLAHLKNFFDVNDESTVEIGGSLATGSNNSRHLKYGANATTLEGVDLTYKWRPLREGLYKSLIFQNELLFSQKDMPRVDDIEGKDIRSWGAYSSLQYQFAKRWSLFGRYDFSEYPDYSKRRDNAGSVGFTFAQSEYCFWRLQYKHTNKNYDKNVDEVWLQCDFGIGPHRAHQY